MSEVVKVEFWALYEFKKAMQTCVKIAETAEKNAKQLMLEKSAFGQVESAEKVHKEWADSIKLRQREAGALRSELEAVVKALGRVIEMYGLTDEALAEQIRRARKLGYEK